MGDFNASESTEWIRDLVRDAALVDAYRAANPTATGATVWQRSEAPDPTVTRRVDFIFVQPGTAPRLHVRSSDVVMSTPGRLANGVTLWPSDHYGVLAGLTVGDAPVFLRPPTNEVEATLRSNGGREARP